MSQLNFRNYDINIIFCDSVKYKNSLLSRDCSKNFQAKFHVLLHGLSRKAKQEPTTGETVELSGINTAPTLPQKMEGPISVNNRTDRKGLKESKSSIRLKFEFCA